MKRKRLLLTIHSGLALIIKTTELPYAGAPPSHLASSPICSNRLCCRHKREGRKAKRQKTKRSPQALLREAFILGGLVIPGAPQKNTHPSRVGTMELVIQRFFGYSENGDRCWEWVGM